MTLRLHPTRTALVVVDVQRASVDRGPHDVDRVLDDLTRLVGACRRAGVRVFFIQHEEEPGSAFERGTAGWELARPLSPKSGDRVMAKRFNSAFRDTPLRQELENAGVDTLIVSGIQTEYCVDTTVRVAFEHGYQLVIPRETHTTFDNGQVSAAVLRTLYSDRIWEGRFARVAPIAEVLEALNAS